jgi:hypothetical protein
MNKQFQVGQRYGSAFMSDADTLYSFVVVKRTAKTITARRFGELRTYRITHCDWRNAEQVSAGRYSMAPIVDATEVLPQQVAA